MNTMGRLFRITIVGESHGEMVGVIVDGVPAGMPFSESDVQPALDRRRPGQSLMSTQRNESDRVRIRTGVLDGRTTGAPVMMEIANEDKRSQDYAELRDTPRPGHSDYPASIRFGGHNDPRGGGMFSGRLTACWVMAGALAAKVLAAHGIHAAAYTSQIGPIVADAAPNVAVADVRARVESNPVRAIDASQAKRMEDVVMAARSDGDSVGGVVACAVEGVPAGVGSPILTSVEAELARAMFGIPAVKGFGMGDGFGFASLRGSEASDPFALDDDGRIVTRANHNGGVLGGITTGMPLRFSVAFKPTSSIPIVQRTLNLRTGAEEELRVKGRHDPCIVPRAVPVVEATACCVVLDLLLERLGSEGVARVFQREGME